jgi:hypothetical protein
MLRLYEWRLVRSRNWTCSLQCFFFNVCNAFIQLEKFAPHRNALECLRASKRASILPSERASYAWLHYLHSQSDILYTVHTPWTSKACPSCLTLLTNIGAVLWSTMRFYVHRPPPNVGCSKKKKRRRTLRRYFKCYCVASVTKTFTLHRSMDNLYACKCKHFRNTHHTATFGIPL